MVDVLNSKEVCVKKIDGFVRVMGGQAIASAFLELDSDGWTSILNFYFNHVHHIPKVQEESIDSKDKEVVKERTGRERKQNFIFEAWEVYRVGVMNQNLGPFRRMLNSTDNWLSAAVAVHVVEIGENMAIILQYLGN
ncbi:hypothetical protein SUGI_1153330 [Cryptomeria japonica]|nr:hypothetical protein SUGI_1153330 [Cryptomeria japonica]